MDRKQGSVLRYVERSIRIKQQVAETASEIIVQVAEEIVRAYRQGNKVVWFGNGGSAADAQHLSAELVGKFYVKRKALASIALTTNTSILTAIANDYGFSEVFARQVEALVNSGDVVIGITTSGKSRNVLRGLEAGKQQGATTVALIGAAGMKIRENVDYLLVVPSEETALIQESHMMVGHIICYLVERELFGEPIE